MNRYCSKPMPATWADSRDGQYSKEIEIGAETLSCHQSRFSGYDFSILLVLSLT